MLATDKKVLSRLLTRQISAVALQNCIKSDEKYSTEKPMLLNFVDLSTIFSLIKVVVSIFTC